MSGVDYDLGGAGAVAKAHPVIAYDFDMLFPRMHLCPHLGQSEASEMYAIDHNRDGFVDFIADEEQVFAADEIGNTN